MNTPKRIQLRRIKGWRKPPGAVVVSRPSKWSNPYRWTEYRRWNAAFGDDEPLRVSDSWRRRFAVVDFEAALLDDESTLPPGYPTIAEIRAELAGKDLCCWCSLDEACHGDVLLKVANPPEVADG